jgi:hypothetical protein
MKYLVFLLSFSSIVYSQEISSFRDKKEVFLGFNYDVRFDTAFYGVNLGYTRFIENSKRIFYRIDVHNHKQYYSRTFGNIDSKSAQGSYFYEDLTINRISLNNMFSCRFFQKHKDRFYFELGLLIGIDLWQQKKGKYFKWLGAYQYENEDILKTNFLMPKNFSIHLGCGIRASKKILLKPELRLSVWTFDKVYYGNENRSLNTVLLANFNVSYMF